MAEAATDRALQPAHEPRGRGARPPRETAARRPRDRLVVVARWSSFPTVLVVWLVWLPALASVGAVLHQVERLRRPQTASSGSASQNYDDIATIYPPFWPAMQAQPDLAGLPLRLPHAARHAARRGARPGDAGQPLLPDRVLPAGRAVAGARRLHLAAVLLPRPGPDQRGLRHQRRLVRRPDVNLWAVLVATAWRHTGYIMLHLPGRAEGRRLDAARGGGRRRRERGARRSSRSSSR